MINILRGDEAEGRANPSSSLAASAVLCDGKWSEGEETTDS